LRSIFIFIIAGALAAGSAFGQSPATVERDILVQLKNVDKFASYSGSFDEEKLDAANSAVRDLLVKNGDRLDVLQYGFPKLKDEMYIATSPDGKLRIYSWDLETGGTMHDYDEVFQYQATGGQVHTWTAPSGDDQRGGGYYTQIFQVDAKSGPIYLANSNFIAQGTIHGQSIEGIRISGDKLDVKAKVIRTARGLTNSVDFAYDPSSLGNRSEKLISFDGAKQQFTFPVVVEDKTYENGRVTSRLITYRFNGEVFVKV